MIDDKTFRAMLALMMDSDPWPVHDSGASHEIMTTFVDSEAIKRGYSDWVDAYHDLFPGPCGI